MLIDVTLDEFEKFKVEAENNAWGWPAALSTNQRREIWPPTGRGYTPLDDRKPLHGPFPFLAQVVDVYLQERPEGGRFFVGDQLAYYKPEENDNPRYAFAVIRIRA